MARGLACLFYSLPNLGALEIRVLFDTWPTITREMPQHFLGRDAASTSRSSSQALKRSTYFTDYDLFRFGQWPEFGDFQWLFYLPSIETMGAAALESQDSFAWPGDIPSARTLTALHLRQSLVAEEILGQLLTAMPNLKTFEYSFLCDAEYFRLPTGFLDFTEPGHALQSMKSSIENLVIISNGSPLWVLNMTIYRIGTSEAT